MARQSLVERTAEQNLGDCDMDEAERLVSELRVSDGTVEFKTLEGGWNKLGDAREFAQRSVDEIVSDTNAVISEDLFDSLQEFSMTCSSCWDDRGKVFSIGYQEDEDKDLKSLVVPIDSSISENFVVQDIHDDNGEFVAGNVEEQVDFEMYKIWGKDMYIKDLSGDSDVLVESKRGYTENFSEAIEETSKDDESDFLNQGTATEWLLKTVLSSVAFGIMVFAFYSGFNLFAPIGLLIGLILITFIPFLPMIFFLFGYQLFLGCQGVKNVIDKKSTKQYRRLFEPN